LIFKRNNLSQIPHPVIIARAYPSGPTVICSETLISWLVELRYRSQLERPYDRFVMTSGGGVPFDNDLLETVVDSTPLLLRESPAEAIEGRRFAEAVYCAAITDGLMQVVTYQDPSNALPPEGLA
jgi:hypothetical protein